MRALPDLAMGRAAKVGGGSPGNGPATSLRGPIADNALGGLTHRGSLGDLDELARGHVVYVAVHGDT